MRPMIVCIVEGHGDAWAIPELVSCLARQSERYDLRVESFRCPRSKIIRSGKEGDQIDRPELTRAISFALKRLPSRRRGAILITLDADDSCPAEVAHDIRELALSIRPDICFAVVLAKREYEAWLIASIESLRGKGGIREDAHTHLDPESIADAKGYLSQQMIEGRRYSPTVDQQALTRLLDPARAASVRSFRKLMVEVDRLVCHVYAEAGQ